jgi:Zn-dependent M16 (insulinase) family peptidase
MMLGMLSKVGKYTTTDPSSVVYAEMQGRENLQGDLMDLHMRRLLYPEGDGFRYETGGMTPALRVLTADRIRQFHKDMYQPKNVRLVLIGEVDHSNLLDILDEFEDGIIDRVPSYDAPFKRPWVDSKRTPPLSKTVVDTVEFPEEDESTGEVQIAFLGPETTDDKAETALNTVLTYLAGSSVSVLVNTLVEKEHLTSMVYFWVKGHTDMIIMFTLTSVATGKLADAEKRFFEVLKDHMSRPLDMNYMKDCLHRFKRQVRFTSEVENDGYKDPIIKDHIFGNRDGSQLFDSLASLSVFDELEEWTEQDWKSFTNKWITDAHHVSILGKPSIKLSEKIKAEEAARIKAQQEKLGEDGLKKLAQKLEEAKAENDKPIPEEILARLRVPGTESIHFFDTTTARSGLAKSLGVPDNSIQKVIDKDENGLPLFIHFEHIPTSFVHFGVALGTAPVPTELKPLLGVYLSNFFATPIVKDGKRMEFEEVITALEKETIEYSLDRGTEIGNSEMVFVHFVAEAEKFEVCVKWLATMLVDSVFDTTRLIATVKSMLADVPAEKRDGDSMAFSVDRMIHYDAASSVRATNTLVKGPYLKRILKLLKTDPEQVIQKLESLRKHLLTFSNFRILAIADLTKLSNPVSTFKHLTDAIKPGPTPSINPIDSRKALLSDIGRKPGGVAHIIPMPIDSSFAVLTSKGPDSYTSPLLPPLMVALAYLDAVEGPMWQNIRGTGLAYGTNFFRDLETGLLKFRIYKSPNAFSAFQKAKNVVEGYASGKTQFDIMALEGAISSIVRQFVDERATIVDAARGGFVDLVVRGLEKNYSDWILGEVRKVTENDIKKILTDVVTGVFEPEKTDLVITCGGNMVEVSHSVGTGRNKNDSIELTFLQDMKKNFENAGFKVQSKPLADFQDGYGLEGEEDDEEEEEDDDDDEESDSGDEMED